MITVWGLKTCDTCRKAQKWMKDEGLAIEFKDLRADGVEKDRIAKWAAAVGTDTLLNKASTTWRGLSEDAKQDLGDAAVLDLLAEHPALIKRPVFETESHILVGFKDEQRAALKAG